MALIKCPECGKEISDKSENCIHCGYPLKKQSIKKYVVNNKEYDLSFVLSNTMTKVEKIQQVRINVNCGLKEAKTIVDNIYYDFNIQEQQQKSSNTQPSQPSITSQSNQITCPKCGSTSVTTGQRGFSLLTGFVGLWNR